MPAFQDHDRVSLNYEGATFRPSLVYLLVALALLFAFQVVRIPRQISSGGTAEGSELLKLILGLAIILLFLLGIADGFFVLSQRFFTQRVSIDGLYLYINRRGSEVAIPLSTIEAVSLTAASMRTLTRGRVANYLVFYSSEGRVDKFNLAVYPKTRDPFQIFIQRVRQVNPALVIREGATSLDRLFTRGR